MYLNALFQDDNRNLVSIKETGSLGAAKTSLFM